MEDWTIRGTSRQGGIFLLSVQLCKGEGKGREEAGLENLTVFIFPLNKYYRWPSSHTALPYSLEGVQNSDQGD